MTDRSSSLNSQGRTQQPVMFSSLERIRVRGRIQVPFFCLGGCSFPLMNPSKVLLSPSSRAVSEILRKGICQASLSSVTRKTGWCLRVISLKAHGRAGKMAQGLRIYSALVDGQIFILMGLSTYQKSHP